MPSGTCLGKDYVLPKQKDTVKVSFLFWQGQKDGLCPLAVPKICFGLERRKILTAAPSSPRFNTHRVRFGDDARHARAERSNLFTQTKKKKHRLNRCFLFLAGAEGLEPSARGFGVVAVY